MSAQDTRRSAAVVPVRTVIAAVDALLVRLARLVSGARVRAVSIVVLPLVGLFLGLILITAGCGPPS